MDGDERLTSKSKEFICCRECDDGWDVEEEEEEEREAILDQKRGKTVWTVLTEAGVKQTHQCFSECKAHDSRTKYLDGGLVNAPIECARQDEEVVGRQIGLKLAFVNHTTNSLLRDQVCHEGEHI